MKSNLASLMMILVAALVCASESAKAFYDPGLQRWINRDPLLEMGGLNQYAFVRGNPVNGIDPYGECFAPAIPWLIGAAEAIASFITANAANAAASTAIGAAGGFGIGALMSAPTARTADPIHFISNSIANAPPAISISVPFPLPGLPTANSDYRPRFRPKNPPPGTIPINQHPDTKDRVHPIKDDLVGDGVGPDSWVGVDPDGNIIVTNPDGSPENLGPHDCYGH